MLKVTETTKVKKTSLKQTHTVSRIKKPLAVALTIDALIVRLLTQFINVETEKIDTGITQALQSIGEFSGADRAYIFLYSHNRAFMSNTHEWCREGIEPQMSRLTNAPTKTFSWFDGQIAQKKVVSLASLDQLPDDAKNERSEFEAQAIQSLICVPMVIGEDIIGFVGLDAVKMPQAWSEDAIELLKTVGEFFANAIERKYHEEQIQKLNQCFLGFEPDPIKNINRLVALCGELIEADCALYNRLTPDAICVVGRWKTPDDLQAIDKSSGHICYDVVQGAEDSVVVIRHLPQTKYARTDPAVERYRLETYLGHIVRLGESAIGTLCLLFKTDFVPTQRDRWLIGVIASAIAIEEKRLNEKEALGKSEDRYRSLFETTPDVIFTIDTDSRAIISLNPAFEQTTGWLRAQWLHRSFVDIIHPLDLPLALELFGKVLRKEQTPPAELRFCSVSGEYLTGEVVCSPQLNNDQVVGVFGIVRNITEKRKTEEQLSILSRAIEQSPNIVMITGIQGNIEFVNAKFTETTGYSREEVIGKNPSFLKSGHTTAEEYHHLWKTITSGGKWQGEFCNKKKNGDCYWGHSMILPIRGKDGMISHYLAVEQDITERKKAEEVMREQSAAIKASMDGMAILDKYEKYVYLNEAHAKIYGYGTADELVGQTWRVLYDDDELRRLEDLIMPIFWKEGQWRGEAVGKRRDGSKFPQEISLTAIENGGMVCVVRDISERKSAEESLRASEALMRTVFDTMPHWVFVKDMNSRMLLANKKMAADYGVRPEDLINVPTEDTPLGVDAEKAFFVGVDQQVISTGQEVEIPEEKITRPDGEIRYLHTIKVPLKDLNGRVIGLVGVAQDITERKKAEKELDEYRKHLEELVEERTRELRHSERLAATGRLAASIAHEINNPLQGITTHLEIMHDHLPPNFTKMKNYDFVRSNIDKIRGIVTKLLDTYRGSDEGKTEVNINDVVEKVGSLTEHQLQQRGIRLTLKLSKDIPRVFGWNQQLYQVFLNLILNAQDSIKDTGCITVSTFYREGLVAVDIADTGEGIHLRDMDHLFEPFFTTKAESGTGLGLFVSQGIIKEHNGIIKVKSEVGKGSIFTILLPPREAAAKNEILKDRG